MHEQEHPEPSPLSRFGPRVNHDMSDVPDGVLAAVRRELAKHTGDGLDDAQTVHDLGAAVCEALADEVPDHHGPMAQSHYATWLDKRADALRHRRPWTRPITTTSL